MKIYHKLCIRNIVGNFASPFASFKSPESRATWLAYGKAKCQSKKVYHQERQVTKPTFPLQSCRSRTGFRHFRSRYYPAPELSLVDAKNNPFRNYDDTLYWERQLWSGNKCPNPVGERQLCSGNVGFVIWRSSSYM